jgi:hypothetical protein
MNILSTEFRVLGGMWCGDVVALNISPTRFGVAQCTDPPGAWLDVCATTATVSSPCLFPTLLLLSFATGLQFAFTRLSWVTLVMWLMKRGKGKRPSRQQ